MKRPLILAVMAGFAATLAALVVYLALRQREAELRRALYNTVEIAVAVRPLPLGTRIEPGTLKMARWPRDLLPEGAVTDPQTVMNSVLNDSLLQNEPILTGKLYSGGKAGAVMPLLIPSGMRAMAVPVDEVADLAGFILPHVRVDVLVALSRPGEGNSQRSVSKVVLQNVEVLAVAQELEGTSSEPKIAKVVTLLVTPDDAERLALASREGTVRLAMRNYTDDKIVRTNGADIEAMLQDYGGLAPAPIPIAQVQGLSAPRPRALIAPVQVEIVRDGNKRELISFVKDAVVHRVSQGASAGPSSMPQLPPERPALSSPYGPSPTETGGSSAEEGPWGTGGASLGAGTSSMGYGATTSAP
jgi:pilus assembly protein CpaB